MSVRVLLTDGAGPTGRQAATHLAEAGHEVHALAATPLALCRFTRHVRKVHRVPAFGRDPWAWLDAALAVLASAEFDALLPTHEQVAVLAREAERGARTGVPVALPPFDSLRRVQDKVAADQTLVELGLPRPKTRVVHSVEALAEAASRPPVYVKTAIGTASAGVHHVRSRQDLDEVVARLSPRHFLRGVLVQHALPGEVVMLQAVYDRGSLVAWHANERVHTGVNGGGAVKRSVRVPAAEPALRRLGAALRWHGALSLDALRSGDELTYVDVNPRLVEPGNGRRAGVDLTAALLAVTVGCSVAPTRPSAGATTHQALIALLGVAQRTGSRRRLVSELGALALRRGRYAGSAEELTPMSGDPASAFLLLVTAGALIARPAIWRRLAGSAVDSYALTEGAWDAIAGTPPTTA